MKKKLTPLYLSSTVITITSILPITVSCQKKSNDDNQTPLPEKDHQKYLDIKLNFEKIDILDLNDTKLPKNFGDYFGEEYFNKFAKTWAFGVDDFKKAKDIDKTNDFMNANSNFLKYIKDKNYESFFEDNFKIILRTQYLYSTLLFKFFLLSKEEFDLMQSKTDSKYFDFKYYSTINKFVYPSKFKSPIPENTPTQKFFKIASYVIPTLAIVGLASYIGIAIAIKKRKQKLNRGKYERNTFKDNK